MKELSILLAALLCSLLAFAAPAAAEAAPATQAANVKPAGHPVFILVAGEVVSGEAEGVLQLDRTLLGPLLQAFLHALYPQPQDTTASPQSFPASKGDCGLHTILNKSP